MLVNKKRFIFFIQTFLCQNKLNSNNVIELQRKIELELQSFRFFFTFTGLRMIAFVLEILQLSDTISPLQYEFVIGYFMVTFDKTVFLHHEKR